MSNGRNAAKLTYFSNELQVFIFWRDVCNVTSQAFAVGHCMEVIAPVLGKGIPTSVQPSEIRGTDWRRRGDGWGGGNKINLGF